MALLRSTYIRFFLPIALGLLALTVPLLRDFHIESALLAAFIGSLWAGWQASQAVSGKGDVQHALSIVGYLYLSGLPLLVYALVTGCFSVHGLGFWLLYPMPSVFFGFAIGRLFRMLSIPYSRMLTLTTLVGIAAGGLLIEFYVFPQVYFFNHVWGGWPGPIYDETVQLSGSLLYFRFLTLLWVLLLWFIPHLKKGKEEKWIVILSASALLFGYIQLSEAGIISPRAYIQQQLGGRYETEHFRLSYAKDYYSEDEINMLALEHEFFLDQIADELKIAKPDRSQKIESYLYAHPWQKKKLVGAKFTSYVPVWLDQDQLHIAKQQIGGSLKHELVHVLAKQFGNWLFNASWSTGLIEGLAVAVSPDESENTTIDQIVVAEKPWPGAVEMQHALSPLGFYGGRSAVNYTTSGSFVKYLLNEYPVSTFKAAYRKGSIATAYPASFEKLVEGWHRHLETVEVDSLDRQIAQRLFGIRSLFEKKCPHTMSDFASYWDGYRYFLAEGDTAQALRHLNEAYRIKPKNLLLKSEWSFMNLKQKNIASVQNEASRQDSAMDLQLLYADAYALAEQWKTAGRFVDKAQQYYRENPDSLFDAAIATRMDTLQWQYYLEMTYKDSLFGPKKFQNLYDRTQIRTIDKAISKERWDLFNTYAELLSSVPLSDKYFENYLDIIHMLAYQGNFKLASEWIDKVSLLKLRPRYVERLDNEKEWVRFLAKVHLGF